MQDTGTSFCFVCLFHLANERGLKIEVGEGPGVEEGGNMAGELWGLKEHSFHPPSLPFSHHLGIVRFSPLGLPRSERCPFSIREGVDRMGSIRPRAYTRTYLRVCYRFVLFLSCWSFHIYVYVLCSSVSFIHISKMGLILESFMTVILRGPDSLQRWEVDIAEGWGPCLSCLGLKWSALWSSLAL